jgi:epoxyqueuosine reductase
LIAGIKAISLMVDSIPNYQDALIDSTVFRRFSQSNTTFGRRTTDPSAIFYKCNQERSALSKALAGHAGYSRVEAAMVSAAWTAAQHFDGAYTNDLLGSPHFMLEAWGQYDVVDPAAMSQHIKTAARLFGAVAAGISRFDPRWVYALEENQLSEDLFASMKFAIALAIPMDAEMILTAPELMASVATGAGYSRMAVTAASLAQFIRHLGYQATAMGNDTALSIPIAMDAGLGQLGRLGLLVTKAYGPCVRLCKVFTDIPLVADTPVETGLLNFCKHCAICAHACPGRAISFDEEPSYRIACPSNNPGIKRWAVNADRCYRFWMENGSGCSKCIAACPFTQRALQHQKKAMSE